MKVKYLTSLLILSFTVVFSQSNYMYTVDLNRVVDDKIKVELITPKINKNNVDFYFAKIIPGTYQNYDFGRLITKFQAFDSDGNSLEVIHDEINTFTIKKAKGLKKITYWVDDTFDLIEGKKVSGMSGSNIEEGKNFILNGHGFYGYFENMKQLEYHIKVLKPTGFSGSSAMNNVQVEDTFDIYKMPSFNYVVDTPIMYCVLDSTIKELENSTVLVSVYSPSKNVTSNYLSEKLNKLLDAQKEYMGGKLPVDKYAFLMYFLSRDQNVGTGALEHNYSSLYVLPDLPQERIIQPILNISAHEFFHVITPLNIHSKEIQYFDFNKPKMSKHLWLYEGVTEYFAHHAQLVEGLIDLETFLAEMGNKITSSKTNFNDLLPFTELSLGCLDEYRHEYANVYQKGALIGLCLDIYLRKYSKGQMGLIDLLNKLSQKYGPEKPFKDKTLFNEISRLTYPEIKTFFERYVEGNHELPFKAIFQEIGIEYKAPESYMGYDLGGYTMGYNRDSDKLMIQDISNLNAFGKKVGYQVKDELLSFNGEQVPSFKDVGVNGINNFLQSVKEKMKAGETFEVKVKRDNSHITLSTKVEKVELTKSASLTISSNATLKQMNFRNQWIKGAKKES